MPPKQETTTTDEKKPSKGGVPGCILKSPGPKYKLRTLVGYREHCISKHRGPAYTIGGKQLITTLYLGPGPKYAPCYKRQPGFSFGIKVDPKYDTISPGPKYFPLPDKGVAFSLKSRTPARKIDPTPGPYKWQRSTCNDGITMGIRLPPVKIVGGSGPYGATDVNLVKPKAPVHSIAHYVTPLTPLLTPGPKYEPKIIRSAPNYSFGTRHGECVLPLITDCDDLC